MIFALQTADAGVPSDTAMVSDTFSQINFIEKFGTWHQGKNIYFMKYFEEIVVA
jgi:hypothetical protein